MESIDDGATWLETDTGSATFKHMVVVDNKMFAYGASYIYTLGDYTPVTTAIAGLPDLEMKDRASGFNSYDLAFGNDRFVAVGGRATSGSFATLSPIVRVSVNGKQWRDNVDFPYGTINSVMFRNGVFIAVGDRDTFIYSYDGLTWTEGKSYDGTINTIEYLNGVYFAVGNDGLVMTSSDGFDWVVQNTNATDPHLNTIAYANGTYVAMPAQSSEVLTSSDGITWTKSTVSDGLLVKNIYTSGSLFYGFTGTYGIRSSTDGVNWSAETSVVIRDLNGDEVNHYVSGRSVKKVQGLLIGTTTGLSSISETGLILTSSDGVNWFERADFKPAWTHSNGHNYYFDDQLIMAYGNGIYVALSSHNSHSLYSSDSGVSWQDSQTHNSTSIASLNGELFLGHGSCHIDISANNGVTWSEFSNCTTTPVDFAYGAGAYVLVGSKGHEYSVDGRTWADVGSTITADDSLDLNSVIYANGLFVSVGDNGAINTSTDGVNWQPRVSGTSNELNEVIYGHAGFIAAGSNNTLLTSADGITWEVKISPITNTNNRFYSASYHSGVYLLGYVDGILRSVDGVKWTKPYDSSSNIDIISEGSLGFLVSTGVDILRSADLGKTWYKVSELNETNGLVQHNGFVFGATHMDNNSDDIAAINEYPAVVDNCPSVIYPYQTDSNNNGIGDACDSNSDSDNDGLSDQQEIQLETDPVNSDTDKDEISDGWEIKYHLNPLSANDASFDSDNDGLTNLEEFKENRNPTINEAAVAIQPVFDLLKNQKKVFDIRY